MTHRDRVKDFERRVRAIERRMMWEALWRPLIILTILALVMLALINYYPVAGKILVASLSAIGLPLALWWGRPKK